MKSLKIFFILMFVGLICLTTIVSSPASINHNYKQQSLPKPHYKQLHVKTDSVQVLGNNTVNGLNYLAQIETTTQAGLTGNGSNIWNNSYSGNDTYTTYYLNEFYYTQFNFSIWYTFENDTYNTLTNSWINNTGVALYNTTDPVYGTYGSANYPTYLDGYSVNGLPLESVIAQKLDTKGYTITSSNSSVDVYDTSTSGNYLGTFNITTSWTATKSNVQFYDYEFYTTEGHTNGVYVNLTDTSRDIYNYSDIGGYSYNYTYSYSDNWYTVSISNNVLDFYYSAYINTVYNYTEQGTWNDTYYNSYNSTDIITFTNATIMNGHAYAAGDKVPVQPGWANNYTYVERGTWNESYKDVGTFKSASALQTFYFGLTTTTNSTNNYALWTVYNAGNLIAYKDHNNNGMLDVVTDPNTGLAPYQDVIQGVGIPESYSDQYIHTFTDNNHYIVYENNGGIINQQQVNDVNSSHINYNLVAGNPTVIPSNTPLWITPFTSGNVTTFGFGMDYSAFPVTWSNTTGASSVSINMNLGWHYYLHINPSSGYYTLDTSFIIGALPADNLTIQSLGSIGVDLNKTSLATATLMTFYTTSAVDLSASQNLGMSTSNITAKVNGADLGSVSFAGIKSKYLWVGNVNQTVPVKVSVLELFSVRGSGTSSGTDCFSSHTLDLTDQAIEDQGLSGYNYSFQFTESIIITSYDKWDGKAIIHDPTYSAVSVSSKQIGTTTSSTHPAPGFEFSSILIMLAIITFFAGKKRNE